MCHICSLATFLRVVSVIYAAVPVLLVVVVCDRCLAAVIMWRRLSN